MGSMLRSAASILLSLNRSYPPFSMIVGTSPLHDMLKMQQWYFGRCRCWPSCSWDDGLPISNEPCSIGRCQCHLVPLLCKGASAEAQDHWAYWGHNCGACIHLGDVSQIVGNLWVCLVLERSIFQEQHILSRWCFEGTIHSSCTKRSYGHWQWDHFWATVYSFILTLHYIIATLQNLKCLNKNGTLGPGLAFDNKTEPTLGTIVVGKRSLLFPFRQAICPSGWVGP